MCRVLGKSAPAFTGLKYPLLNSSRAFTLMNDRARELASRLIRNFNEASLEHEVREPLYESAAARLGTGTVAHKLGASVDVVAPGKRSCPYHFHHAQEEMFVIIEGEGSLRVAGEMLPIKTGDVLFIPAGPEYPHQIINTSQAPLKYLSISTRETPEVCEYPDSGKYQAMVSANGARVFTANQRTTENVDYWDGEP
ncbi:Auxin-binding protein [Pseudomonas syringae pv. maculicola]|nr:Auxin-binding protein [Pseudomonas syringae pv. maculicola]